MEALDTFTSILRSERVVNAASTTPPQRDAEPWLIASVMHFDHTRAKSYSDQISFLASANT